MVNKAIFKSYFGKLIAGTNTVNHAGAPAYALTAREALAQYAVTGTFNDTFHANAGEQLDAVVKLAAEVEPEFLAKVAIYAAEKGHMKDMPVMLLAMLSALESDAFARAFPKVVKSGKMLRGFVQVMRSGATGRKSLGTRPKKMVQAWFETRTVDQILHAMVGNDPSLPDVIKMVHPKPKDEARAALYAWAIGKPYDVAALPAEVMAFEAFKRDTALPLPNVPFQMLTSLGLSREQWAEIALKSSWQMARQNLNTFARNHVFEVDGVAEKLAVRLADPEAVRKARVFPYQLMVAWQMVDPSVPTVVKDALQDAMETAISAVPTVYGNVVVCPDVSGSMSSPVTGHRKGATTVVRCIDVAALVAASFLRRNRNTRVLPFENNVVHVDLNGRDSVMTNAAKLAAVGGGGTNCSAPLHLLVKEKAKVDLVVFVSDNQSWIDAAGQGQTTAMMDQWAQIKRLNPAAKLVCLDIQPYVQTPATGADILNIGGFSDAVYGAIESFAAGKSDAGEWVRTIETIDL
ncbi:RNA-binding protein [Neorhizobium sp. P12A]|uniref:TROVE domain-containing protein n=1 Tax=Rhizobium/Agrobacterium group TaxID=227290 RepID=UPI0010494123|nr:MULTISPECIES: TROVE domain-containing protein [Rhizobium/Agrobacterium group]KAA0690595.1 RNA-binding protein [Neorhizobium sp. P12A]TCR81438.1 60 kDa SS-A/Ro ribonucleoprotein [Rhizobium sp. BK376]